MNGFNSSGQYSIAYLPNHFKRTTKFDQGAIKSIEQAHEQRLSAAYSVVHSLLSFWATHLN